MSQITLSSSVDVSSGKAQCPNTTVEFTCIATEVAFMEWIVNDDEIEGYNAGDMPNPSGRVIGPYVVFLDAVSVIPGQMLPTANITSRLAVNLSHLLTGTKISCSQANLKSSVDISYTIRGPPPAPSDYVVSYFGDTSTATTSITFAWNSTFNYAHAITSYRVAPITADPEISVIECPPSCPPNVPCLCTGLAAGEQVNVSIRVVNCGDQVGPVSLITVASSCRGSDLGQIENSTDSRCGSSLSSVSIANGVGCYNTTSTGSVVTYQCDEGYSLTGESQQTCQNNGTWSESIPVCTESSASMATSRATTGLLVCTVLLLVTSFIITIIGPVVMTIRKVSIQCWHTICLVLLGIEGFLLLIVIILLIVFGVVTTNPNRITSSLIVAFAVSVFAFIWIIGVVGFLYVKTAKNKKSAHLAGTFVDREGKKREKTLEIDSHKCDPNPFQDDEVRYSQLQRPERTAHGILPTESDMSITYYTKSTLDYSYS